MDRRPPAVLRREEGFSLLELTVALMLVVVFMVTVAGTLRGALATSRANRFRQEATAMAMESFEHARSLGWDSLAMDEIDPYAPMIDAETGVLLSYESGLAYHEDLLVCATGQLPPKTVMTVEDVTYTTWTYVTRVNASLRRVVVLVTWEMEDQIYTHRSDSVISVVSAGGITAVDQPIFPEAAIVATGNVALHPGSTSSNPSTAHSASIWLNQSFSNLDAVVDGDIVAGGVVTATPANVHGTIEQNAGTPVNVPDMVDIELWRGAIKATAQGGTSYIGNLVLSDTTITAPYYVQGTLELQGNVHISGTGPVYATGMIRLQADALVTADGAHLVSESVVLFETGSEWAVSEVTSAGVISFAAGQQAITVNGGGAGTIQGLAYAPYGGIKLQGVDGWHGVLVAHGNDGLGEVDMAGGAWIEYPANLLPTTGLVTALRPPPVPVICG